MAAHGPPTLRTDPAFTKYADMTKNRWKYFRWTPRTAFISFMWAGFVPFCTWYVFKSTEGKYYMRGKLRGDTISEW